METVPLVLGQTWAGNNTCREESAIWNDLNCMQEQGLLGKTKADPWCTGDRMREHEKLDLRGIGLNGKIRENVEKSRV